LVQCMVRTQESTGIRALARKLVTNALTAWWVLAVHPRAMIGKVLHLWTPNV
jgi:hypothetical protein